MKNSISCDGDSKDQGEERNSSLTPQSLFGIAKETYYRTGQTEPEDIFLGHGTAEALETSRRKFQIQKARAIMHVSRLQTRVI